MNKKQKDDYRSRMFAAQLFRSLINQGDKRAQFMESLGVTTMPVIIPALGSTPVSHIRDAAYRYFDNGEEHVIVPVLYTHGQTTQLCVLIGSTRGAKNFWELDMSELDDSVTMSQVIEALDSDRKWSLEELDSQQQQELQDLVASL